MFKIIVEIILWILIVFSLSQGIKDDPSRFSLHPDQIDFVDKLDMYFWYTIAVLLAALNICILLQI